MKLEVGMFVRTDKTGIKKIYKIDNNKTKYKYLYKLKNQDDDGYIDLGILSDNNIIKASFDIIDLIEVGDYVNGREVIDIKLKCDETVKCLITHGYDITNEMIKSIVTKEQFEAMEYRLGDKYYEFENIY